MVKQSSKFFVAHSSVHSHIHKHRTSNIDSVGKLGSLAATTLLLAACGSASTGNSSTGSTTAKNTTTTTIPIGLSVFKPSWQLRAPLSRMVLLNAGSDKLAILGGLTASDTSASGVFELSLANGTLTSIGNLPAAVHDAAGAEIGSKYFVIGGGSVSTVSSVEAVPISGGSGTVTSNLPQPRSDCSSITVGGTTIVVGGYNGTSADPSILSTTNGISFKAIGDLKIPVRYAALAASASGNSVYVFGGIAVSGQSAGSPVSAIQKIDLATGAVSQVGTLPEPLEGAQAFSLNGHVYLAGGDTGSGNNLTSSGAVYSYTGGSSFTQVATLSVPVSNAGVAVQGGSAWLVGGETNGKTSAVVQSLKAN